MKAIKNKTHILKFSTCFNNLTRGIKMNLKKLMVAIFAMFLLCVCLSGCQAIRVKQIINDMENQPYVDAPKHFITEEEIEKIEANMTLGEIRAILGPPHADGHSGVIYPLRFVWFTEDERGLGITFSINDMSGGAEAQIWRKLSENFLDEDMFLKSEDVIKYWKIHTAEYATFDGTVIFDTGYKKTGQRSEYMTWLRAFSTSWFLYDPAYTLEIVDLPIENLILPNIMLLAAFLISVKFSVKKIKETKQAVYILAPVILLLVYVLWRFTAHAKASEFLWWLGLSELLLVISILSIKSKDQIIKQIGVRAPIILLGVVDIVWLIKETIMLISVFDGDFILYASMSSVLGLNGCIIDKYDEHLLLLSINLAVIAIWGIIYITNIILKKYSKKRLKTATEDTL